MLFSNYNSLVWFKIVNSRSCMRSLLAFLYETILLSSNVFVKDWRSWEVVLGFKNHLNGWIG